MRLGHLFGRPDVEWKEWLHPRGFHGRFVGKGGGDQKAPAFVAPLAKFLETADFRTFGSDGQIAQYLHNTGGPSNELDDRRLVSDLGETNAHLRMGESDPSTQRFVAMMDRRMQPAKEDLLVNRTVGPEAFGLTPETMGLADGGMADFPGALVADRGYSATTMGSMVGQGPISMTIAVPKGTKIAPTRRGASDRGVMLDKGQPLRITKVTPDGKGGFQVMAVATQDAEHDETPIPLHGPEQTVRTPQERETELRRSVRKELPTPPQPAETQARVMRPSEPSGPVTHVESSPVGNTNTGPNGPPPRNEPVHAESIGHGGAAPQAPAEPAPAAPTPEAPSTPETSPRTEDFREAVRAAGVPTPPNGPMRREWNEAFMGVASGKKHPLDALRELERDIADNERRDATLRKNLPNADPDAMARHHDGIEAQKKLADLIAEHYGLERHKPAGEAEKAPAKAAKKAAPSKAAPTTTGVKPSEGHRVVETPLGKVPVAPKGQPSRAAIERGMSPEERRQVGNLRLHAEEQYFRDRGLGDNHAGAYRKAQRASESGREEDAKKLSAARAKLTPEQKTEADALNPREREAYNSRILAGENHNSALEKTKLKPAPAKKAAPERLTEDQKRRIIDRVDQLKRDNPDFPRNSEEERLQREADQIRGASASTARAAKKATPPPVKKAEPKKLTPTQENKLKAFDGAAGEISSSDEDGLLRRIRKDLEAGGTPTTARQDLDKRAQSLQSRAEGVDEEVDPTEKRRLLKEADRYEAISKALGARGPAKPKTAASSKTMVELREEADAAGLPKAGRPRSKEGLLKAIEDHKAGRTAPPEPKSFDKMTKAELLALPVAEGAKPSWTKERIRQHIDGAAAAKTVSPESIAAINPDTADELHMNKEQLLTRAERYEVPGREKMTVPELRDAIAEARPKRQAEAEARVKIPRSGPGGSSQPVVDLDHIKARFTDFDNPVNREEADRLLAPLPKAKLLELAKEYHIPGSSKKTMTELRQDLAAYASRRQDSIATRGFRGVRPDMPETTLAEHQARVENPAAHHEIQAPDRKKDFKEAWNGADIQLADTSAGRSTKEVVGDISTGHITPEEGIRRLENDITDNKSELADMDSALRSSSLGREREDLKKRADALRRDIAQQEKASAFLHKHFEKAPEVTPDEVKAALVKSDSPEAKNFGEMLQHMTPDDVKELKKQAKDQGLGDLEGETGEEVFDNAIKKMVADRLKEIEAEKAGRPAKKAVKKAAPKAPEKPLPEKPDSPYERLDTRSLAEGLDLTDPHDHKMLDAIQKLLDGDDNTLGKNPTPARVGRYLEQWNEGPSGPRGSSAIGRVIHEEASPSPERDAHLAELGRQRARGNEWQKLADRLMNTRRQRKQPPKVGDSATWEHEGRTVHGVVTKVDPNGHVHVTSSDSSFRGEPMVARPDEPGLRFGPPKPEPAKVTPAERKDLARAAEVTGIPQEQLEKRAVAKKVAAAAPKHSAQEVAKTLGTVGSREEADDILKGRTKAELADIYKALSNGHTPSSKLTKLELQERVRELGAAHLTRGALAPGVSAGPGVGPTRKSLMDGPMADIVDLENELKIKRNTVDKGDRVDAIMERLRTSAPSASDEAAKRQFEVLTRGGHRDSRPDGPPVRHPRVDIGPNMAEEVGRANGDEPLYLPNQGADQGLVHLDSQLGQLWHSLAVDNREPNSFVNEIAHIGERVGLGELSLQGAATELHRLSEKATDKAVADRIERAAKEITDGPPIPNLDVPDSVPGPVRDWLHALAEIPTMRRTDIRGHSRDQSVLDEALDLVRQISGPRTAESRRAEGRLRDLPYQIHESVDGAYQARRLTTNVFREDIVLGYRRNPQTGRAEAITEPNPDYPMIRDWVRQRPGGGSTGGAPATRFPVRATAAVGAGSRLTPPGTASALVPMRELLKADTGPAGVQVNDLHLANTGGYRIPHGTAWREHGVTYIVEHQPGDAGTARAALTRMRDYQATLPDEMKQYQDSYAWLQERNPQDAIWAARYGNPDFISGAAAGGGEMTMWARREIGDLDDDFAVMDHETGHNVDDGDLPGPFHSYDRMWQEAAKRDQLERTVTSFVPTKRNKYEHSITLSPRGGTGYPYGVTDYGKSSDREDYAEALRLYRAGPLGTGVLHGQDSDEPVWFRDLFPVRAAIFDRIFPYYAQEQLLQIRDIRALESPRARRNAARDLGRA